MTKAEDSVLHNVGMQIGFMIAALPPSGIFACVTGRSFWSCWFFAVLLLDLLQLIKIANR